MSFNVYNLWYGIAMYAVLLVVCAVAVWLYNRSVRKDKESKHQNH